MAVIDWKWIHEGRAGGLSVSQHRTVRRYTRVARVQTNDPDDDSVVVTAHASCPLLGTTYPNDLTAWCRTIDPSNDSRSRCLWLVTCNYSSEYELSTNPLAEPASIEWGTEAYQRIFYQDKDGYACVNSAGDYYDPGILFDDDRWVVSVSKNLAMIPTWILSYRCSTNSTAFVIDGIPVAARYAKLCNLKISPWNKRNNVSYRIFSYGLQLNDDNWDYKVLDAGFNKLGAFGYPEAITVPLTPTAGNPARKPTVPVQLDGAGHQVSNPDPSTAVFNSYKLLRERNFNLLPLT